MFEHSQHVWSEGKSSEASKLDKSENRGCKGQGATKPQSADDKTNNWEQNVGNRKSKPASVVLYYVNIEEYVVCERTTFLPEAL